MLEPSDFAGFVGFTESEVKERCKSKKTKFEDIKAWYDGYDLANPFGIFIIS